MSKLPWLLFVLLCIAIGLYPVLYLFLPENAGLLSTKSATLLDSPWWRIGFYTHISLGGLALLVGWTQFSRKWRTKYLNRHRLLGKVYVLSVLLSGSAAFGIGFWATGGPVAQSGFIALSLVWLYTTLRAYLFIRAGETAAHERMMIFSYAACFAAVMLRLWLPLLIMAHQGAFDPAYRIVAWLCWVPNMGVAWWLIRRRT